MYDALQFIGRCDFDSLHASPDYPSKNRSINRGKVVARRLVPQFMGLTWRSELRILVEGTDDVVHAILHVDDERNIPDVVTFCLPPLDSGEVQLFEESPSIFSGAFIGCAGLLMLGALLTDALK